MAGLSDVRSMMYGAAKLLGHVQACCKGRVVSRAGRVVTGKVMGKLVIGRLFPGTRR